VNEHVIDPSNEITRIIFIVWLQDFRSEPVEKSYFPKDDWFFCLEECFANPGKNSASFEKPL
jgi:hypothetical protein